MRLKFVHGFSLIELLVSITILAVISTVAMVIYTDVQKNARDSKREQDLTNLAKAISLYRLENKSYPPSSCSTSNGGSDWSAEFTTALAPYMNQIPKDPFNKGASWLSQPGCPGQMSNGSSSCVYCFSPNMTYFSGTSGPPNLGAVYAYQERCSSNSEIGDGARFGLYCPHYVKYIEPL